MPFPTLSLVRISPKPAVNDHGNNSPSFGWIDVDIKQKNRR